MDFIHFGVTIEMRFIRFHYAFRIIFRAVDYLILKNSFMEVRMRSKVTMAESSESALADEGGYSSF